MSVIFFHNIFFVLEYIRNLYGNLSIRSAYDKVDELVIKYKKNQWFKAGEFID